MTEQEEKNERLLSASFFGDSSDVKKCLNAGADVNAVDEGDDTPLHNACMRGEWSIAELLLDAGADVSARNNKNTLPIERAFQADCEIPESIFERLNKNNDFDANRRIFEGWRVIHLAARYGGAGNVRFLLSKGADPNAENNNGWTPLVLALRHGKFNSARVLLDAGAKLVLPVLEE